MSHTPGPWFKQGGMLIGSDGRDVVAAGLGLGLGSDSGDGVRTANARLIAAAPELLEALKWTLARVERLAPHQASEGDAALYEIATARAAIQKATGEQA